jgi:non-ribosomal peptide synthetase component F
MTMLAAFGVLVSRYASVEDIAIGAPIANRTRKEIEPLIGFFVNTLILRLDLSGNPTFLELLSRVRHMALEAYAHQDMPFEQLVEELQPQRDMSRNPLVQVSFAYQNVPMPEIELEGLRISPFSFEGGTVRFDLEVHLWDSKDGGLKGPFIYYADIFEPETIRRFITHYVTLLEGIAARPEGPVSELPLLTESERVELRQWGSLKASYLPDSTIVQGFEEQAALRPQAVAVSVPLAAGTQRLTYEALNTQPVGACSEPASTYEALNNRANQLACYLRKSGVRPEVFVGVYMHRSLDLIVSLLESWRGLCAS